MWRARPMESILSFSVWKAFPVKASGHASIKPQTCDKSRFSLVSQSSRLAQK
jgi:hypothetical protein